MTSRITATPDPVQPGQKLKVCYDFDGATSPVTLTLYYDPPTPSVQITLSAEEPCKEVVVPQTTGLTIIDDTGQSDAHEVTVSAGGGDGT